MSKLASLAATWKDYDLYGFQSSLDVTAEEVTRRQEETSKSRSDLIGLLTEFKTTECEDVRSRMSPLIKAFQNQIDRLEVRSQYGEKAFMNAYTFVCSLVDPVPVLQPAIDRAAKLGSKLQDAEITEKHLRETMAVYEGEIVEFKAKEKELQKLQSLVAKYDKNIDETLNERMIQVTKQMTAESDERIRQAEEEKAAYERKYRGVKDQLESQARQLEETNAQLFEISQKASERIDAKSQEADLLMNDIESWQQRALMAEKEVESLNERLEQSSDVKVDDLRQSLDDLETRSASKDLKMQRILEQLNEANQEKAVQEQELTGRIERLNEVLEDTKAKLKNCELKLESQKDHDSLKRELSVLRCLEFPDQLEASKKPVEVVILERSKTLQSENATLRMDNARLSKSLDNSSGELAEKCAEYEKQSLLVAELELHLDRLQQISSIRRGEAEGRSSVDILKELEGAAHAHSPAHSDVSSCSPCQVERDQQQVNQAVHLLPIVQGQRERFKQRNEELEAEKNEALQQLGIIQTEVEHLKRDNVKLYEKIRYLQGYQRNDPRKESTLALANVESRYKSQYEQGLDPFKSFSIQERQKHYGNLNVIEKVILFMVRFMLGNKFARLMIFAYAVFLHLLVFMVLMRMAMSESHARQVAETLKWQQKYDDHMNVHHPVDLANG